MRLSRTLPAVMTIVMMFGLLQASITPNVADAAPALSESAKKAFLNSLVTPAQQAQKETGIPASALIAQAIVESEWGTSSLSSSKNVFNTRCSAGATTAEYASLANKQVGKPYVLGQPVPYNAASPKSFDCSGLVIWLNNQARSFVMGDDTAAGLYNRTTAVSGDPVVGDLVFLKNNPARSNGIGHVAVVTAKLSNGDWRIIEAKGKAYGVVKTTLSYWKTRKYYTGVRRLANINFVGVSGVTFAGQASSYSSGCTVVGSGSKSVKYRTYTSLTKAVGDRAALISSEADYRGARAAARNVPAFVDAIAAVDSSAPSDYAAELKDLIETWSLTSYDVASTAFTLVMTSSSNSTGSKVSALQSLLNQAGQKVTVNGTYDAATKKAVTAYQKANGLAADGEAGPLTLTALFGGLTLKSGSSGHAVTALHTVLTGAGYPTDSGSTFGKTTLASVRQFQSTVGLSSSGTVDAVTWPKLFMLLGPTPVPTISGEPKVGTQLTAKAGSWGPGTVEFSYQWHRDGKAISKATSSSYQVSEADLDASLTVAVTGTRLPYISVTRASAAVVTASLPTLTATPKPTVSGTVAVGKTLTAGPGTWQPEPVGLSYQWYRGAKPIAGATKASYTIQNADSGSTLTVAVTGTKDGYRTASITSDATKTVPAVSFSTVVTPKITGTARVGLTLKAGTGTWKPSGISFSYRWYRNGKAISGATKSSYKLVSKDKGTTITVKVTGKKSGYTTVTKTSKATAKVAAARKLSKTPKPAITGSAKVGVKLKAKPGTWGPSGVKLTYRWYRNGKAIAKATKSSYKLAKKDKGTTITVKVTGKKAGYVTVTKTSRATAKVKG